MLGLSQHVKASVKTAVRSARTRVVPNVTIYFETSSYIPLEGARVLETFAGHYYINILVRDRYMNTHGKIA